MRRVAYAVGTVTVALAMLGCGHDRTVVRRETVTTVPAAPIVTKRTTVETVPAPPSVESETIRTRETTRTIETED